MGSEGSETNSLNFYDFWAGYGVDGEVLRGAKLRNEKQKNSQNQKQLIPADFNINISAKNLSNNDKRLRKQSTKKYRCPMRIAELAIPTKRHCLDTWKQRGNTLPNYMVDRLRQHVMDQKAVVHIKDAIKCFKSCKLSRKTKKNTSRMTKKKLDKATLLCCLFGHKIVLKLLPSGRIPIDASLINLSRVINEDIGKLVGRGKNINDQKAQNEISDKLAVWIATILQDTDFKLMIDDLKDLEERQGHIWDIMDDLINEVSESCESGSISNGEEYASTTSSFISIESKKSLNSYNLDKISHSDELIVLVPETKAIKIEIMHILADIIDNVYRRDTRIETFIQNHIDDMISNALSKSNTNEIISIDGITNIPTIEDLMIDRFNDIVLATDIKPTLSYGSLEATFKDSSDDNKLEDSIQIEKSDNEENKDFIGSESTQPEDVEKQLIEIDDRQIESCEIIDVSDQGNESTTQYIKNGLDANLNSEHIQNGIEVANLHETDVDAFPDDSSKKVKFSDIHIGSKQLPINDYNIRNDDDIIILHKKLSSSSQRKHFQHNINFSHPNTHILCNMDEIWPDHLYPLTTKPSVTVSKSIMSLGLIMEGDEKTLNDDNERSSISTDAKINKDNKVKEATLLDLSNLNESIQSKVEITKTLKGNESDYILNVNSSPVINKHKLIAKDAYIPSIKLNLKAENMLDLNLNSQIVVSSRKPTKDQQIQTFDAIKIKLYYKPISQQKLRIWCIGLDNVIINVDKWFKWIKYTHKIVLDLKNNDIMTSKERVFYIKQWQKLKKSIDSDAQLWFHLYKGLVIGMKRYRSYYTREIIKSLQIKPCVCNTSY